MVGGQGAKIDGAGDEVFEAEIEAFGERRRGMGLEIFPLLPKPIEVSGPEKKHLRYLLIRDVQDNLNRPNRFPEARER
jgi:hypothetical protein